MISELASYLQDNMQSWALDKDGSYARVIPQEGEASMSTQQAFLDTLAENS